MPAPSVILGGSRNGPSRPLGIGPAAEIPEMLIGDVSRTEDPSTPSSQDPAEEMSVRAIAVVCLIAELLLVAWGSRGEWHLAAPALLLVHLVGLLGFGLYWLAVRGWKRVAIGHEELFLSAGLSAAGVTIVVTYTAGEWMGVRSVIGSVTGGVLVGLTLVLARLAIWGSSEDRPRSTE